MILVTGANGKTGRAVIAALSARGAKVRALVRRADQQAAFNALGVDTAIGSFDQPDTLVPACEGVEAIYHICPNVSASELDYARYMVAAAKANGVRRFVYHSVLHPQIEAMPHHWAKMRTEEVLFTAGLDLTVLQPTAYMQNLLGAWRGIVEHSVLRVPYPAKTRLSLIDLNDVAAAAALVLTGDGHTGATYELAGTPPLSQNEVAAAIGGVLRKSIRIEVETIDAWQARVRAAGMGEHERTTLAAMFRYYAEYGLVGSTNTLRWSRPDRSREFYFAKSLIMPSTAAAGQLPIYDPSPTARSRRRTQTRRRGIASYR
jgi:NAD(P)H dehydrogenase (quinone)